MSRRLDTFIRAAPQPQRLGMRVLVTLARRPRGVALLTRAPLAEQAAHAILALDRYDEPTLARTLGWDADAVVARGRKLRRTESRP